MKNLIMIIGLIILIIGCKPSEEEMQLEKFFQIKKLDILEH